MFVIKYKKLFLGISAAFMALSLAAVITFGLKLGIDFTGGSALEIAFDGPRPSAVLVQKHLADAGFGDALVQPIGDDALSVKTRTLTDAQRAALIDAATQHGAFPAEQRSFTAIGPTVGGELKRKAILAIVLSLAAIICFVAYSFRKVSKPVSSWKYGFAVIVALVHDILIPTGFFAILGRFAGAEVDTLFVVALLTTLALSISDTIVVFDRVRENIQLPQWAGKPFASVVAASLSQTFVRSLFTSFATLVTVIALAIFGPSSTQLFATILAIGMFFGIYSSIFLASPLLVLMEPKKDPSQS